LKKNITLPLKFWARLEEIHEDAGGTLSDAVYAVLDVGFTSLDGLEVPEEAEEEEEKEEEEPEENESEEEEPEENND